MNREKNPTNRLFLAKKCSSMIPVRWSNTFYQAEILILLCIIKSQDNEEAHHKFKPVYIIIDPGFFRHYHGR